MSESFQAYYINLDFEDGFPQNASLKLELDFRPAKKQMSACWCQKDRNVTQWRSQNAEKVTHIKGRLLGQAMILVNCVPFQNWNSLKGKNLLPEGANSFLYWPFLLVLKSLLPHWVTSLECYYFITHMRNCVMGATPMSLNNAI